jgi:hypothetical protein
MVRIIQYTKKSYERHFALTPYFRFYDQLKKSLFSWPPFLFGLQFLRPIETHPLFSPPFSLAAEVEKKLTALVNCAWSTPEAEFMNVQFVEVSGHYVESSQTLGLRIQCLHHKPVSNHFCSRGAGGVKSVSRGDCE